mmetsp:Transcript_82899/g.173572  ORF Transcript_82899/g.173572 Transcript_82899/m.173572 type:complete len:638 (+) Transcript_82899:50-1963(+)|eukprot:CAMPEP_0206471244 /NCGR_PEP_ID=MMETSP0324_2-20121206/31434_1 /ASSEMBLY_ACC=CAM_ASM_000836 /TAXON_ID=2866 /ORGANISM="Crypthecodinium cohnii, Strain Seligo" /LENGTH=637 /DNA_ID=CAMNT_0053945505 /DNA_START=40 /DNA_END=1950 /DNA_ORIENTATION=+
MRLLLLLTIGLALALPSEAGLRGPSGSRGGFFSSQPVRHFNWTSTLRTAGEGLALTFPKHSGWQSPCFEEAGCSWRSARQQSKLITQEALAWWVDHELLEGPDPFGTPGTVPVPWPETDGDDQVGLQEYVSYTRRQVCFIAAKALLGADTDGYDNGLSRILKTDVPHCAPPSASIKVGEDPVRSALTGEFGMSLWYLLAACAADPSLQGGREGPSLLVAKGSKPAEVAEVRTQASSAPLRRAQLGVCRYDDGDAGPVQGVDGLLDMSEAVCVPPTHGAPGKDFMTSGVTRVPGQAIQDISAKFLGGYVFGNACGLGGGQDERLMVYMPEVFVLSFFLSEQAEHPQLREPSWILGARMLMLGLDGTARFGSRMEIDPFLPMTSDVVPVNVDGRTVSISSTTPFLGFMSENQDFLDEGGWWSGTKTLADLQPVLHKARQNREPQQRAYNESTWYSFMYQVRAWYSAVDLENYNPAIQPVLLSLVNSLGTGPFLAGLWWGDSQLGFLMTWIAQAVAAKSWGARGLPVEYYLYSDFTENPGNQCLVLAGDACRACLKRCADNPLPDDAYWLPDYAFFGEERNRSCVLDAEEYCGTYGLFDVVEAFKDSTAAELWERVEEVLASGTTEHSVFDLMLDTSLLL